MVAPDAADTPMSVASEGAEPYMPTPASTVGSTGKENRAAWASGRPNHWLSDHRNPMYGQVELGGFFTLADVKLWAYTHVKCSCARAEFMQNPSYPCIHDDSGDMSRLRVIADSVVLKMICYVAAGCQLTL